MLKLLKSLTLSPLYHLFIASPSRHCSRLSFVLALIYGHILSHFLIAAVSGSFTYYLQTSGFPFAKFGQTRCYWTILSEADTPAYKALQLEYLSHHGAFLQNALFGLRVASILLSLFMLWRLFMLVIQRCNGTLIKPLWATLISAGVLAAFAVTPNKTDPTTIATLLFTLWALTLALVPNTTSPIPSTPTGWMETWIINPTRHAFAFSLTAPLSGLNYLLAHIMTFVVILGIYRGFVLWAELSLDYLSGSRGYLSPADIFICNTAIISSEATHTTNRMAMQFLYAFSSVPAIVSSAFMLAAPLIVLTASFGLFTLLSRRLRVFPTNYPIAWAVVLTFGLGLGFRVMESAGHEVLNTPFHLAFILILATYRPTPHS